LNRRDELLRKLAAAEARLAELTGQQQQAQALVDNLRRQTDEAAPLGV
jgi:molecular chaperone GrpE (heat shock protein)